MNLIRVSICLFSLFLWSCGSEQTTSNPGENSESQNNSTKKEEKKVPKKNIIFFGNSLTAAYNLDPEDGFVALLQKRLDSLGYHYNTINSGNSGETTAGGKERIDWVLRQPVDIFVLELGGNDGLRGIDPASSYDNLKAIIEKVKNKYPASKIIIAGMQAPPNMGERFTNQFQNIFPKLAAEYGLSLIPFFLENVGGIPELNLRDGIHPNEDGQKIVAENVWKVLKGLL